MAIHALALSLGVWASAGARPRIDPTAPAERDYTVDLLSPTLLRHARAGSEGRSAVSRRGRAAAAAARARAERAARARKHALARAARLALRRQLEAPPPAVPAVLPPPLPASLARVDYGGPGTDSVETAAQIVANHHDPTADELAAAPPRLVAFTEAPKLLNPDQVRARLSREYPEYLQAQGIGGRVVLWFLVAADGTVRKFLVKQSSGHGALDRAALKVAKLMRFSAALNYDRHVAVWVALPVVFRTVDAPG